MNYQHYFHAGSAADVFKHCVLITLLDYLKQKDKAFCYIDTHAGAGEYDLSTSSSREWQEGLGKLKAKKLIHPVIQRYYQLASDLSHYPGSPSIARHCIRSQDEIILNEKAEQPYQQLKKLFFNNKQIHIHQQDAYLALKSLIPPKIKRGLVLIDPPYESPDELSTLPYVLKDAIERWPMAIYLLWYPIKTRRVITQFYETLQSVITYPMLALELCPWPDDVALRLNGSGLIMINPPWKFAETAKKILGELLGLLKQDEHGKERIITLKT